MTDAPETGRALRPRTVDLTIVGALIALGAVLRATGFTRLDLWFDDAWASIPARTNLSQSLHMVLTAPGYGLVQRSWIRLFPETTWWAQLPAYLFGLAAIPALYLLVRFFRFPRTYAIGAAAFVSVAPIAVMYSTRVKQYPFDLLMTCVLLALFEVMRRNEERVPAWPLAAASVFAVAMSASCAVSVLGVWIAVGFLAIQRRDQRRQYLIAGTVVVAGAFTVWLAFLRHVPNVLNANWRRRGYLIDWHTFTDFRRTTLRIFGSFAHTSLGVAVPRNFYRVGVERSAYLPALVGLLVVVVVIAGPLWSAWRRREVTVAVTASVIVALAVILAFTGEVPLGDGRTDEVLYPAFVIGVCSCVQLAGSLFSRWAKSAKQAVSVTLATLTVVGALAFGVSHTATYPSIDLRTLAVKLSADVRPGDVIVVDTFNSFGWCYYTLSTCSIQIGGHPEWPQGFQPVSTDPGVLIPARYKAPYPDIAPFVKRATRVWYVGYTYGTFDVGTPWLKNVPGLSTVRGELTKLGWRRPLRHDSAIRIIATNAYAVVLIHHRGTPSP